MRTFVKGMGALVLASAVSASAGAQGPAATTAWRAWLGCWSAASTDGGLAPERTPIVCVSSTDNADVARFTTVARDTVLSSQLVDASGRTVPLQAAGCTGTQVGSWSADQRRVYLSATATCDGAARTTSSIIGMSPAGEWIDVQAMGAEGAERVRVARYRGVRLDMQGSVPPDVARALGDGGLSVQSARMVAGADIGVDAVVEAARVAGVSVTEAYVMERGQRYTLDARQLVALADAGVSPRITDALIAASNPSVFAVRRPDDASTDSIVGRKVYVSLDRYASPFGWGYDPYLRYGRGYDSYGYYGYYGSQSYGNGYFPGAGYPGYTGGPVIIVKGAPEQPHGRLVKGHGYESGDRTGTARTTDRIEREPARTDARGGTAESTRATTSSGSSGSDKTERVAKPRP